MARFMKIARKTDIGNGEIKGFSTPSCPVLIANINGRFYAMDSVCPHAHAPLEDGVLEGKTLKCPWHGSTFDLETGRCTSGPAMVDQHVYNLKIEDGVIQIEMPDPKKMKNSL